jgi:hypothetical protein
MCYSLDDLHKIAAKEVRCDVVCSIEEDMTRQEFKEECDVNHILRQHGYVPRPVVYGEHNFDDDMTARMQSRSLFEAWYAEAPAEVRELYSDLGSFLRAFGAGAFKQGPEGVDSQSTPSEPSASPPEAGALG